FEILNQLEIYFKLILKMARQKLCTKEWKTNYKHVAVILENLIYFFSFTAIGVQGQFVTLPAPSTVCIMGHTYYRMLPIDTPNHSLNWYIYDEQERYITAQKQKIPNDWENSSTGEIVNIMHTDNIVNIHPRSIIIWRNTDIMPRFISIFSSQYELLQYPLLFSHGTLGWHIKNNYNLSQIDWYRYRLLQEQRFLKFRRLTSEYLVDMYSRVEEEYFEDEIDENKEENLHLPASFLGSKRWCSSHVVNALALARSLGKPSFFITMTTNPNWKEIHSQLQPGQNALEITPIVVLCVQSELPINQIDKIIMAELSREKSPLRELVEKYMIHKQQHSPRCLRNGKCIYNYPKPIIPETHVNEKGFVQYCCHMQEDFKNTSESKNYNRNDLGTTSANSMPNQHINEFEDYINGRYLSATEAAWRIFRYPITMSDPSVLALPIHLPNANIP
ncbi:7919_t:CDS:2, partial [Gigaspora margarita]